MLINNKSAEERLNSPMNLINHLKDSSSPRKNAMSLFIRPASPKKEEAEIKSIPLTIPSFNPFENKISTADAPPVIENLIPNSEEQVKLGLAHDNALKLLNDSVALLAAKLDDVKVDKLPAVIAASSKVVESIRRDRNESAKNGTNKEVHYHFYTPTQKTIADYKVIDVTGSPA